MTDGASQGLFVIVAVVIFGIFIVISYMLFRDKMSVGLASVFDDSIILTQAEFVPFKQAKVNRYYTELLDGDDESYFKLRYTGEDLLRPTNIIGIIFDRESIIVPYGYRLIMKYDVRADNRARVNLDLNGSPLIDSEPYSDRTARNDSYTNEKGAGTHFIEPDTWYTFQMSYDNTHPENTMKDSLRNHTTLGFRKDSASMDDLIFEFRNIQYKLLKIGD